MAEAKVKVEVSDPHHVLTDKPWYKSKKVWIWFVSFVGLGAGLFWAIAKASDWKITVALVAGMTMVSCIGLLGQAFVDAVVRFAQAWRGLGGVWSEDPGKK